MGKKVICCAFLAGLILFDIFINVSWAIPSTSYNVSSSGIIYYSSNPLLRVDGKQIVDNWGNPVFLRGCGKMGLEYANPAGLYSYVREVRPEYYAHDAEVIASWGANLVRVNFGKEWYDSDPEYRRYLRQLVDAFASRDIYILMALMNEAPGKGFIYLNMSEEDANLLAETLFTTMEQVVRDYADQPMVVGVEINEFWPMQVDGDKEWNWILKMGNTFAQRIHAINPNLLIFVDMRDAWNVSDSVIDAGVQYITEPNIVLAPHIYEAKVGFQYQGKYYPNDGGDFWTYYQQGNYEEGKNRLYQFLDVYYKQVQDIYGLPVVVTEFAGDRNLTQPLEDIMKYFSSHGWGYSYHTYYGPEEGASLEGYWLLESDWTTLSPTGQVFVEGLHQE